MSNLQSRDKYEEWWVNYLDDDNSHNELADLVSTLAEHVRALQNRIDKTDSVDYHLSCACAYEYPTDVCMIHKR